MKHIERYLQNKFASHIIF